MKTITAQDIYELAKRVYGLSDDEMLSRRHAQGISDARATVWLAIRYFTEDSSTKIGQFWHKDHSTILTGYRKIQTRLEEGDARAREMFDALVDAILSQNKAVAVTVKVRPYDEDMLGVYKVNKAREAKFMKNVCYAE